MQKNYIKFEYEIDQETASAKQYFVVIFIMQIECSPGEICYCEIIC